MLIFSGLIVSYLFHLDINNTDSDRGDDSDEGLSIIPAMNTGQPTPSIWHTRKYVKNHFWQILDSLLNKFQCQLLFDGNFKTHKKFPSRSPACYRWETSMLTIRSWYRPQKGQGFSTRKKQKLEIQPCFIRRIVWVDVTVGGKPHVKWMLKFFHIFFSHAIKNIVESQCEKVLRKVRYLVLFALVIVAWFETRNRVTFFLFRILPSEGTNTPRHL